jgi:diadenosine tetraphosphate (Ap4A) HIT family hydrolase
VSNFAPDARLIRDSDFLARIGLCELRIMNDSRWPWLVLIPQRPDMSEIFDLSPLDQSRLSVETNMVAAALKRITGADKINIGALGNIVRQLHVHIVARREGDANWPGPVWGFGKAEPWTLDAKRHLTQALLKALQE